MKNSTFGTFLLLYYSQVLGLNPALAGLAVLLSLIFDAVTDPLTGSISDSWRSRLGRRHGFMYAAAVPLGLAFYFVWSPPEGLGERGLFAWMLAWTVLTRGAMTLYHVPHMALGAELSSDYTERTRIVAYRNFFGFVGAAVVFAIAHGVFMRPTAQFPEGQLNPAAYPPLGLWFGAAMGILILLSALGTHARIPYLPKPGEEAERFSFSRLGREVGEAVRNPSFRVFFFGLFIFFIARGIDGGLSLYMGTFFWKLGTGAVILPLAGLIAVLIGTLFWAGLAHRMQKKPMFMTGITGFSAFTMLLPIAKLVGLFPAEESAVYVPTIYFFVFVASFFGAAGLVSAGSMLADIADEHELQTRRRQEGIFFGALSLSGKASAGIGSGLAGLALAAISFPLQARVEEVDPWTVTQLAIISGPGVLVLVAVAIVIVSRYALTRERHAEIRAELDARIGGGAPAEKERISA
jgi:Na+/melibiose symporter-like transporter